MCTKGSKRAYQISNNVGWAFQGLFWQTFHAVRRPRWRFHSLCSDSLEYILIGDGDGRPPECPWPRAQPAAATCISSFARPSLSPTCANSKLLSCLLRLTRLIMTARETRHYLLALSTTRRTTTSRRWATLTGI